MQLRDIMSSDVLTLTPSQTASDAFALMRDAHVRHAVVASTNAVVGIVSERDLGGSHGGTIRRGRMVSDLMRPSVVTAPPDVEVADAALMVREHHVGCLPVVERGRLLGIVTRGDLLEALALGRRRARARASADEAEPARPAPLVSPNRDKSP